MIKIIIIAVFIAAVTALLILSKRLLRRRDNYIGGINSFVDKCSRFEGIVLDVKDVPIDRDGNEIRAVILQFRDDANRRTIVHRYTGSSGRRYSRGDKVEVYYCEKSDSACIKNDNPFYRKAKRCSALSVLCRFAAVILVLMGIILLSSL